jgi:hypothetical protein
MTRPERCYRQGTTVNLHETELGRNTFGLKESFRTKRESIDKHYIDYVMILMRKLIR